MSRFDLGVGSIFTSCQKCASQSKHDRQQMQSVEDQRTDQFFKQRVLKLRGVPTSLQCWPTYFFPWLRAVLCSALLCPTFHNSSFYSLPVAFPGKETAGNDFSVSFFSFKGVNYLSHDTNHSQQKKLSKKNNNNTLYSPITKEEVTKW